ncbi:MAG: C40 family peptidase [Solirubrobacterales bacterium]|nr:C40 family peptidase [Solirubrobacterales bacterium]
MALTSTCSRHAGAGARRSLHAFVAALLCALALLALPGSAALASQPAGGESAALRVIGHALLAAIGTKRANTAVDSLGNSLALLDARYRIEGEAAKAAAGAPHEQQPAVDEAVSDPSKLAPASAGTNGTKVPHTSKLARGEIFAHSRVGVDGESTAILLSGVALAPPDAPEAVKNVINNANTIVGRPYVWGGGHASFYSYGYDCSGSVSFALFGGGLIPEPLTSGSLEGWGAPGPGKWITVYANAGHTFAEIAGLRWDTVGDAQGTGPRWHLAPNSSAGFVVRHPPGL